jgi:REP element-mobilizing transposase RayT
MIFYPNQFYHVYNRSINRELVFKVDDNYYYFIRKIKDLKHYDLTILAYCLMPTHFHLLIHIDDTFEANQKLQLKIGSILSSYTKAVNKALERHGSLFQAGTKAKLISENDSNANSYAEICFHYIHQNPLKAGLVDDLNKWKFSSYPDYAGIRSGNLPDIKMGYRMFDFSGTNDFIKKSNQSIDKQILSRIYV